jgi:hypothetical protein
MTVLSYPCFAVDVPFSMLRISDLQVALKFADMFTDELIRNGLPPLGVSIMDDPIRLIVTFKTQAMAEALAQDLLSTILYLESEHNARHSN